MANGDLGLIPHLLCEGYRALPYQCEHGVVGDTVH